VGAAWALIGFAAQCFVALIHGDGLEVGIRRALLHYVAWGIAGFLFGVIVERLVEDSFQGFARQREQETATPPANAAPRAPSESAGP
jgi:hypothetical protein